jgi:hypothetical protein
VFSICLQVNWFYLFRFHQLSVFEQHKSPKKLFPHKFIRVPADCANTANIILTNWLILETVKNTLFMTFIFISFRKLNVFAGKGNVTAKTITFFVLKQFLNVLRSCWYFQINSLYSTTCEERTPGRPSQIALSRQVSSLYRKTGWQSQTPSHIAHRSPVITGCTVFTWTCLCYGYMCTFSPVYLCHVHSKKNANCSANNVYLNLPN